MVGLGISYRSTALDGRKACVEETEAGLAELAHCYYKRILIHDSYKERRRRSRERFSCGGENGRQKKEALDLESFRTQTEITNTNTEGMHYACLTIRGDVDATCDLIIRFRS